MEHETLRLYCSTGSASSSSSFTTRYTLYYTIHTYFNLDVIFTGVGWGERNGNRCISYIAIVRRNVHWENSEKVVYYASLYVEVILIRGKNVVYQYIFRTEVGLSTNCKVSMYR